jgi:hypothetical protein
MNTIILTLIILDHSTAQVVRCQLLTPEAWFQSKGSEYEICCGPSGTGAGFIQALKLSLASYCSKNAR